LFVTNEKIVTNNIPLSQNKKNNVDL